MPSKNRFPDPMHQLIRELRTAARQIDNANARAVAAREADRIPITKAERAHGGKGKLARHARIELRALRKLSPAEFAEAAVRLRDCADALDSRFEVISEVHLGRMGRSGQAA